MAEHEAIQQARDHLIRRATSYAGDMQLPITLTGIIPTPQEELERLQQIFTSVNVLRNVIVAVNQLYTCSVCSSAEGEMHAGDLGCRTLGRVTRPPGWTPTDAMPIPVVIADLVPQPCPIEGCIYICLPGETHCAQHLGKGL